MTHHQPKERFTNRVETYAKYRPSYPRGVVDSLIARGNLRENSPVADVGSGTGIFARLLIERGLHVYAVEPNSAMRKEAEEKLAKHPLFSSVPAEATATTLRDSSVEAVTVAQAFHWFAEEMTVREFARILRPEGIALLLWNERSNDADIFHKQYEELLQHYCPEYAEVDHRHVTSETIRRLFWGWQFERKMYENHQMLDWEGLKGRLESSSYSPSKGDANYEPLMKGVQELFAAESRDGLIQLQYNCIGYFLSRARPDEV